MQKLKHGPVKSDALLGRPKGVGVNGGVRQVQMCAMTGAEVRRGQRGVSLSGKRSQTDGDAFIFDASLPLCVTCALYFPLSTLQSPLSTFLFLGPRFVLCEIGQKRLAKNWHVPIAVDIAIPKAMGLYTALFLDPPPTSHDNMTTKRSFTFLASMK